MPTPVSLFDYDLPEELIAQHSMEPRDHSRLMVVDRATGAWEHKRFYEIVDELRRGDVLVLNNTKVFRARLRGHVSRLSLRGTGGASDEAIPCEVFLLRPRDGAWDVLVKPGRHVHVGDTIGLGQIRGRVLAKSDIMSVVFDLSDQEVIAYANAHGHIPIPPYVHEIPERIEQYQTVYAREIGSVAAPTAGFHFTLELLEKIRAKGVEIHDVTLHVGLGTFRPMKSETIEEHQMHSEFVTLDAATASAINRAKHEGRRVIAVGTTTVRTLEGVADRCHPERLRHPEGVSRRPKDLAYTQTKRFFSPQKRSFRMTGTTDVFLQNDEHFLPIDGFSGDINLFITPGFEFKVVDALITNFHLPKSTLLVLVSAFASREHILAAYHEAIRERYRFFSFGDVMFIR